MTRKRRRLMLVMAGLACLGGATALVLLALGDTLVYFYSPGELASKHVGPNTQVRIGGLVEQGSLTRKGDTVTFKVTDMSATLPVTYTGVLPDLFREGQGVVAEGKVGADGTFRATDILAKHDATYMPKEVVEALKKSGRWQEGQAAPVAPTKGGS